MGHSVALISIARFSRVRQWPERSTACDSWMSTTSDLGEGKRKGRSENEGMGRRSEGVREGIPEKRFPSLPVDCQLRYPDSLPPSLTADT